MQNDLLPGSRAAALREVVRALECDAATKAFLDRFVPNLPGAKPYVPVGVVGTRHLLRALVAAGAGFSIDGLAELDSATVLGIDPRGVLCRNTDIGADDIRDAALRGVWRFPVDSEGTLATVAGAAPGAAAYVRVSVLANSNACGQGASAQEALRLLRKAPELGLRPYGLAFRVGREHADATSYARAIDRCGLVMRRLEQFGTRLEMLGLGGALGDDASDPAVPAALARLPYRPALVVAEP